MLLWVGQGAGVVLDIHETLLSGNRTIRRNKRMIMSSFFRLLLMLGLLGWATSCQGQHQQSYSTPPQRVPPSPETSQAAVERSRRTAITRVVEVVSPAVVSVNILGVRRRYASPFLNDPFFQFWRPYVIEQQVQSVGSGFVISPDGYIVTNDHVVNIEDVEEETMRITVAFPDGDKRDAELIGHDPITDIALLKVDTEEPLPYLEFGNSDSVLVGEWVIALGNPFGLFEAAEPTVTVGVISAVGRDFKPQEGHVYRDMLQTDAAINQGNSGGPLVNTLGQVIGVNTFIISPTGQYAGLSFAVPAKRVQRVIEELKEKGYVDRSLYTGLVVRALTARVARALGVPTARGVLVDQVDPGSPAQQAGIKPYDVILAIDGERIESTTDAYAKLLDYRPGDVVMVTVWREGQTLTLKMKLARAASRRG